MTASARELGFPVLDADNHYYEPYDCFTRHLEADFADRALHVRKRPDGLGQLYFGDRRIGFMRVLQTDFTGAPGTLRGLFEGAEEDGGFRQTEVINAHDHPAMMNRAARLALMDRQGVASTLMFPTVGVSVEHEMHDDVDALYANLRSFNRFVEEDWGFGADGRIYAAPMISLVDPAAAEAELLRTLDAGARLINLRPGPLYGASPAAPALDRFWSIVDEARIPVAMHSADSGYNEVWSTQWGESPRPPLQFVTPFQWYLGSGARPIADMIANLVLNDLFGRFPHVRVLSIEAGSGWVGPLLHDMDKAVRMGRRATPLGGSLPQEHPSEVFREHVYVAPFFEEDAQTLADEIGVGRVLFGSDWPHSEGLADPLEYYDLIAPMAPADRRRIMHDNLAGLLPA